ncbi:MAG: shikimate kinase [Halioglobus sp.]|nr:shikimate kinase [Halioglobus sp.]
MLQPKPNIVLIGMPGSGKSTVGVILAKMLSYDFLDTDLLIQSSQQRPLQDIVDSEGHLALRAIEEDILLTINVRNCVIATGGSAVYSERAMRHLAATGTVVFLEIDLAALEKRIHNFGSRGLAKRPEQTLADLFAEREALYRQVADITINCAGLTQEDVCSKIIEEIKH